MTKKYQKRTRHQTDSEKMVNRTIRFLLRQGVDVDIKFTLKGMKNEDGLKELLSEEPQAPEPQSPSSPRFRYDASTGKVYTINDKGEREEYER